MAVPKATGVTANLIGYTYLLGQKRGEKVYELSNLPGNVLVTISDKKLGTDFTTDGNYDYYIADVLNAQDYYPGGMLLPNRSYSASNSYRYGFNGKERIMR